MTLLQHLNILARIYGTVLDIRPLTPYMMQEKSVASQEALVKPLVDLGQK